MSKSFVIGYDPGGNGAHGVAVLEVREKNGHWNPVSLQVEQARTVRDAVTWLDDTCRDDRIVAAGVDTLTEWNSGRSGFRPADLWLKATYPEVANQVLASNSLTGSMTVNGAAFVVRLQARFQADRTMVTEAHPKVCVFALTGRRYRWAEDAECLGGWLLGELGVGTTTDIRFGDRDHCFDAAMGILAALRGLNREWTLDLHALPTDTRVPFIGPTHYWWPPPPGGAADAT